MSWLLFEPPFQVFNSMAFFFYVLILLESPFRVFNSTDLIFFFVLIFSSTALFGIQLNGLYHSFLHFLVQYAIYALGGQDHVFFSSITSLQGTKVYPSVELPQFFKDIVWVPSGECDLPNNIRFNQFFNLSFIQTQKCTDNGSLPPLRPQVMVELL